MKIKFIVAILIFFFSSQAFSQESAWFVKFTEAKTYAETNKVPILLIFAGSDWCKPCMMLKVDILKSEAFHNFFSTKFAILYLDFPMQAKNKLSDDLKKQNEMFAERFNKSGLFPNLVLIDSTAKVLGNLKYKHQTPEQFIVECNELLDKINK